MVETITLTLTRKLCIRLCIDDSSRSEPYRRGVAGADDRMAIQSHGKAAA